MAESGKTCPKCGHVRTANDPAPLYECPKCGAVYKKTQAKARETVATPVAVPVTSAAGGWGKYLMLVVVLAGVAGWYFHRKPPTPPPAPVVQAPPPPVVEQVYDDPMVYARDKVVVTLGEVQGRTLLAKVVNRGKQHLGSITVRVKGFKEWIPDPMFVKDKTPDEFDVDLTNSPFYAESTRESVLEFPKGIQTLVFPGRSVKDEAMEIPRRVPVVRATFFQ